MKKSLVILTTESILEHIRKNNLEVGDKLPNEYDLATLLDVSRSTLREAIQILVSRNILEVRRGSGTYISSKKGMSEDPLGFSLTNDPLKLTNDLFEVRYILEPHVASKAALMATQEDLDELDQIQAQIEATINDTSTKHFELDIQFHSVIARASQNQAINHLISIINSSIWLYNDFYTSVESKMEMIKWHHRIVDAIKDKDSIAAHDAMLMHIALIREKLKKND